MNFTASISPTGKDSGPYPSIPFATGVTPAPVGRRRILIVDDNAIILGALAFKLRANGYDVDTAADGAEAVSAARRQRPDLIIMDLMFPPDVAHGGGVSWDGFLIMKWLQRMEELSGAAFIMVTSETASNLPERARAAGAAAFFTKPVKTEELLSAIHLILDKKKPA
jgi:CheY-like chemotaxis protein